MRGAGDRHARRSDGDLPPRTGNVPVELVELRPADARGRIQRAVDVVAEQIGLLAAHRGVLVADLDENILLGRRRYEVRVQKAQDAVPLWGIAEVVVDGLDRVDDAALGNRVVRVEGIDVLRTVSTDRDPDSPRRTRDAPAARTATRIRMVQTLSVRFLPDAAQSRYHWVGILAPPKG